MNNKFLQAGAHAIRLVKHDRNLTAELQTILEDRLCRFIANSNQNGECRKLGCMATLVPQNTLNQVNCNPITPLSAIAPAALVKFISFVTYNDLATYSDQVFDIAKKIEFIQTPVMVTRILEYVRRFELGTRLSDVYEPEMADLIPVAAELDYPHSPWGETMIFHWAGNTPEFLLWKIIFNKMQLFVPIRFYRQCSTDMILAMFELPNGGHPWPYDKFWMLGGIPAGFFILFAATEVFLFRKSPFVINSLKQLIFYLGMLFGAAAFAGTLFLLVTFARQMPH